MNFFLEKDADLKIEKSADGKEEEGIFSGVMSTDDVDLHGERITLDALKEAAQPFLDKGGHIFDMHQKRVVGKVTKIWFEGNKMKFEGILATQDARALVKNKIITQVSIGGSVLLRKGKEILKLVIKELSLVDQAANQNARIEFYKSLEKIEDHDMTVENENLINKDEFLESEDFKKSYIALDEHNKDKENLEKSLEDLNKEKDNLEKSLENLTKEKDDLAKSLEDLNKSLEDLKKSLEDEQKSKEDLQKSFEDLSKESTLLKSLIRVDSKDSEKEILMKQKEIEESKEKEKEDLVKSIDEEISELRKELSKFEVGSRNYKNIKEKINNKILSKCL